MKKNGRPSLRIDRTSQRAATKLLPTGPSLVPCPTNPRTPPTSIASCTATSLPSSAASVPLISLKRIRHTRRPRLENFLVALQDAHRLLAEGDDLALQPTQLDSLSEHDRIIDLV